MAQETFNIPNISCGHCTKAIEDELSEIAGVTSALGSIEEKSVTVNWAAPADRKQIIAKLKEINYPAQE